MFTIFKEICWLVWFILCQFYTTLSPHEIAHIMRLLLLFGWDLREDQADDPAEVPTTLID